MALETAGIAVENDFFSPYYAQAILEKDLQPLFRSWKREEKARERPPYLHLAHLAGKYFALRRRCERTRSPSRRRALQHDFLFLFFSQLGYRLESLEREGENGTTVSVACEVAATDGAPLLWILQLFDPSGEGDDPLSLPGSALSPFASADAAGTVDDALRRSVFRRVEPPRWVILATDAQVTLIDRRKWSQRSMIRFDLPELFGRRATDAWKVVSALLQRTHLCPKSGEALIDRLDENAHKHAFSVSEQLKYALRESIELIGNEALFSMRRSGRSFSSDSGFAAQLTRECLRFMYRILFLFYVEARPGGGGAFMKSEWYRKGYSLESLRDLEQVKLTTEDAKNGFFLHESLQLLFELVSRRFLAIVQPFGRVAGADEPGGRMQVASGSLFDPGRLPLLNEARLRNCVLQQVIALMSLSPAGKRKKRRGRISYADLGINQLGAVYEALLSYRGFIAAEDLYEVRRPGGRFDPLDTAYFVTAKDLERYTASERVLEHDGTPRIHPKGSFIYRRSGRDRKTTASYYTPGVLTECLAGRAVDELCREKSADEVLTVTVCEPAMGSAAFLTKALNRLSDVYLEKKQRETGIDLSHDAYTCEKRKVTMFLAGNNIYGVDLNPVAVELAELSLWLASMTDDGRLPWFRMQLRAGNSLIGARRQVFGVDSLRSGAARNKSWLHMAPERVVPGQVRPPDTVYHFLLPDRAMAEYRDRVVGRLMPEAMKLLARWKRRFTQAFSDAEIGRLAALSDTIDTLWRHHVTMLGEVRKKTRGRVSFFGHERSSASRDGGATHGEKDLLYETAVLGKGSRDRPPYVRLKQVMDYWCALWLWPLEKARLLPGRAAFFRDIETILNGGACAGTAGEGVVERLEVVNKLTEKYRFFHWELECADLFFERGGFDLVLGNPPWVKAEWAEGDVLGDEEPLFVLRRMTASARARMREKVLARYDCAGRYIDAYIEAAGMRNFLNALQNYPLLKGGKTNLFKCFVPLGWYCAGPDGMAGFITYEGIFSHPRGGPLRKQCYRRLRKLFCFENEKKLFPSIGNARNYEIALYGPVRDRVAFDLIANLYLPATIEACYRSGGAGLVCGMKNEAGAWEVKGHRDRIVRVTEKELALFSRLYDDREADPLCARLPLLHAQTLLGVLEKIAQAPRQFGSEPGTFFQTQHFNETNAQKDGLITRKTCFPASRNELILSGPHFYVANPLYQTPNAECTTHRAYTPIDLTAIADDYLPRTNYLPLEDREVFRQRAPRLPWGCRQAVTEEYRLACRAMIGPSAERTSITAIVPPLCSHINSVQTISFQKRELLLWSAFFSSSLVGDFFLKTTGRTNLHSTLLRFPALKPTEAQLVRTLLLQCLTCNYAALWEESFCASFRGDAWTKEDPRLDGGIFSGLTAEWGRHCSLRTDYARRQALVEIDVLAAWAVGLSPGELTSMYRIQFPVLKQYEQNTWYDRSGRIVFTVQKRGRGVGVPRDLWMKIREKRSGTVEHAFIDDTFREGAGERTIVYHAPFDRCDRERDFEGAWRCFSGREPQPRSVPV